MNEVLDCVKGVSSPISEICEKHLDQFYARKLRKFPQNSELLVKKIDMHFLN